MTKSKAPSLAKRHELTYARAHELFEYESSSGLLTWRISRGTIKAGTTAGSINSKGYLQVMVDGKMHKAHRIAFLLMTGSFPPDQIDHINGVRTDNRWSNLRAATNAENGRNRKIPVTNTSGIKGVRWDKKAGKWRARIYCQCTEFNLGYFSTVEEANAYYVGAAQLCFGAEWMRGAV